MNTQIRLKIISDGTTTGTKVTDSEGRVLPGVKKIIFIADAENETPNVLIEMSGEIPFEFSGESTVVTPSNIITL